MGFVVPGRRGVVRATLCFLKLRGVGASSDDLVHVTSSERQVDGAPVSLETEPSVSHRFQPEIVSHKEHTPWNAPKLSVSNTWLGPAQC